MPPSDNTNRNHLIDLLRFFAASWVAFFHFNEPINYIDNWYRNFCKLGFWGVPVFFIVSGYCIGIAQKHSKKPIDFITRRLCRIYPPYWFSMAVVLVCVLLMRSITGVNSATTLPKTIPDIIASICLYTTPASPIPTINWVYWTLPYELAFYGIIFLILFITIRWRSLLLIALLSTAIALPFQKEGPLFFFNELPTFMAGYALYLLIHRDERLLTGLCFLILSLAGIYVKHGLGGHLFIAIILSALITINNRKPVQDNFLSQLGDFSYSIYLIHVPVGIYLFGFIKNLQPVQTNIVLNIAADVLTLILVVFLSWIMYLKIELPSINLGRKLSRSYLKTQFLNAKQLLSR